LVPRRDAEKYFPKIIALAGEHRSEFPELFSSWERDHPADTFYVVIDRDLDDPVGLICCGGIPDYVRPAWWIAYKNQGYGTAAVQLLADEFKRLGVSAIGDIQIQTVGGQYDTASEKLADYLRRSFAKAQRAKKRQS